SHGRQTWGQAKTFLRTFREAGWLPPPTHPTAPTLLPAAPIAPVWQVWKPRVQRGSWRRRADYRTQRWRRSALRTTLTPADAAPGPSRSRVAELSARFAAGRWLTRTSEEGRHRAGRFGESTAAFDGRRSSVKDSR